MSLTLRILALTVICFVTTEGQKCTIRRTPYHGVMKCTRANKQNSICNFSCKQGFQLKGVKRARCIAGKWNMPFPICRWVSLCRVQLTTPSNGKMKCTNGQHKGSKCRFRCNAGYKLKGSPKTTCVGSKWSKAAPTCIPKRTTCNINNTPLKHGFKGCTGNSIGKICSFTCKPKYKLVGALKATCIETNNGARWDTPEPRCQEKPDVSCPAPIEAPQNGAISCTNGRVLGSSCYFECDYGFQLVGKRSSSCEKKQQNGPTQWSSLPPKCTQRKTKIPTCPKHPSSLKDGFFGCSNGNRFGSDCYHVCKPGFSLFGYQKISCIRKQGGYNWNVPPPQCFESESCLKPLAAPENGFKSCSNQNKRHSECVFECEEGYDLVGHDSVTCETHPGNKFGEWNLAPPKCVKTKGACDYSKNADIVLMLDTSISYGARNWDDAKLVSTKFLNSFIMNGDATRLSVVQYNGVVQKESAIMLGRYVGDKEGFMDAFDNIPSELGHGLSTGNALRYVKDVVLKEENGDRPDVNNIVVLFTGAKSRDDVKTPAKQLNNVPHTTVYVVGVHPAEGTIDPTELSSIPQTIQQFFFAEEGLSGVDEVLNNALDNTVCRVHED